MTRGNKRSNIFVYIHQKLTSLHPYGLYKNVIKTDKNDYIKQKTIF